MLLGQQWPGDSSWAHDQGRSVVAARESEAEARPRGQEDNGAGQHDPERPGTHYPSRSVPKGADRSQRAGAAG